MSKPYATRLQYQGHKLWARFNGLSLPQVIEWHAKGWIRQDHDPINHNRAVYFVEVRQHKPHHTKGRKPRYYLVCDPKHRPLLTIGGRPEWSEYT